MGMDPLADGHVHSEWSWDGLQGSMDATCARAVELGLAAVAFTEHVDFTPFCAGYLVEKFGHLVTHGTLNAPALDVEGYLHAVERCRTEYPTLRVLSGVEVGQPHRHGEQLARLLSGGGFDRVLGSLHCLPDGDEFAEPFELFLRYPAEHVLREYLAEIPRMVAGSDLFEVFTHIDYPVRSWPEDAPPYDPHQFEDEYRQALRAIADGGRALEVSAKVPLDDIILRWWKEEGGERVTLASDGHEPWTVGRGLEAVAAMVSENGFRPDVRPEDPWRL